MATRNMRWSTWIPFVNTGDEAKLEPHHADFQAKIPWPMPAQSIVRAWHESGHIIDVELRLSDDDRPIVTGFAVRRGVRLQPRKDSGRQPQWPEGAEPKRVSPRDVKRLPLAQVANAAVAWAESMKLDPGSPERDVQANKVGRLLHPPRDRPKGRVSAATYEWILRALDHYARKGEPHPVKRIAEDLGEPPAKVHVWAHRAKRRQARGMKSAVGHERRQSPI